MFFLSKDRVIDMQRIGEILNEDRKIFVHSQKARTEMMPKLMAMKNSRVEQFLTYIAGVLGQRPFQISDKVILDFLEQSGMPAKTYERAMKTEKSKGFSFDAKVKQYMIDNDFYADAAIFHQQQYALGLAHTQATKIGYNYKNETQSNDNLTISEMHYNLSTSENRRFNTKDEHVIGFDVHNRTLMTVPDGYLMLAADFPQIDGRVALDLYFKTDLVKEITQVSDDAYLAFKEIQRHVHHMINLDKQEKALNSETPVDMEDLTEEINRFTESVEPFRNKAERDIYKVIALSTVYGAEKAKIKKADWALRRLKDAIEITGRYTAVSYYMKLLERVGYPVVMKSRYGYKRTIMEHNTYNMMTVGLNSPVQSTSSEIILMFIQEVIDHFRSLGYDKDDICLMVNRHDEPIFKIKKEVFEQNVEFLSQVSHILVQGWKPFKMDWTVGYDYGVSIEEYQSLIDEQEQMYDDREIQAKAQEHRHEEAHFPLDLPHIMAIERRILPNGKFIMVMATYVGEISSENYYIEEFKDPRNIQVTPIVVNIKDNQDTEDMEKTLLKKEMDGFGENENFILFDRLRNSNQSSSLGGHTLYRTGERHKISNLARVVMSNVLKSNFSEYMTPEDHRFNKPLDQFEGRIVKKS